MQYFRNTTYILIAITAIVSPGFTQFDTLGSIPEPTEDYPVVISLASVMDSSTSEIVKIAALHGVNDGPKLDTETVTVAGNTVPSNRWDLYYENSSNGVIELLKNVDNADFTIPVNRFLTAHIPSVRLHGGLATDMTHIWLPNESDSQEYVAPTLLFAGGTVISGAGQLVSIRRTFDGEMTDPFLSNGDDNPNYSWGVFDEAMAGILNSGAQPIVRLGYAPYKQGISNGAVVGNCNEAPGPNDYDEIAEVSVAIVEHLITNHSTQHSTPLEFPIYVELWNEPYHKSFWKEATNPNDTIRAENYCDLYRRCEEEFYYSPHGPQWSLSEVILVPQIPAANSGNLSVGAWQTGFFRRIKATYNSAVAPYPTVLAPHLYTAVSGIQESRLDHLAAEWNQEVTTTFQPDLLITEWNRSIPHYAVEPGSVPLLANSLILFNSYTDKDPGKLEIIGANLFSSEKQIWTPNAGGSNQLAPNVPKSSGLLWCVYGVNFLGEAPYLCSVEGGFKEEAVLPISSDTRYRDFQVLAGRSSDRKTIHLLVSSYVTAKVNGNADYLYPKFSGNAHSGELLAIDLPNAHGVEYKVTDIPTSVQPLTARIERWTEANNSFQSGYEAQLLTNREGARLVLSDVITKRVTPVVPPGGGTPVFGELSFQFGQKMKQNSYELIKITTD